MTNRELANDSWAAPFVKKAGGLEKMYLRWKTAFNENLAAATSRMEGMKWSRNLYVVPSYYWWLDHTADLAYLVAPGDIVKFKTECDDEAKRCGGQYAVVDDWYRPKLESSFDMRDVYVESEDRLVGVRVPPYTGSVYVNAADGHRHCFNVNQFEPAELPAEVLNLAKAQLLAKCPLMNMKGGCDV